MHFTWDNTLKFWGKEFNPEEIINSEKPVYLFLEKNNPDLYDRTMAKLLENYKGFSVTNKLLFENQVNKEAFLQLYFVSNDALSEQPSVQSQQ